MAQREGVVAELAAQSSPGAENRRQQTTAEMRQ